MDSYSEKDFGKILKKNAQALRHENLENGTDCFRIYDRNLASFPVTVDLYGKYARVVDYGENPMSEDEIAVTKDIINRMAYVDSDKIICVYRAKREGHQQHEKTDNEAVTTTVKENNLSFYIDLTTYADTGLFLDQALNRAMIKERSAGSDVLNLFSYTGSFSVYAASGLAKTVTSVDLSATYTDWAVKNLENNGFSGDNYKCICMDAMAFLDESIKEHRKYDIVIFDPPSFSNSHKMDYVFDVQKDFVLWIKKICSVLRSEGFILFSTNLGSFRMDKRCLKGLDITEISGLVRAPGFVKNRKGAVRSWIMTVEDSTLTLDWSEDKKPKDRQERRERAPRTERREGREKREFRSDRRSDRRFSDDRPRQRRSFGDDRPRRSFDEQRPRRSFDDRPRRSFNEDRPRRNYDEDRPSPRRSFDERPRRSFDDRPRRSFDEDRPRRNYDEDRPSPRRSFDERPRRSFDDRPRRSFDEDRPRRSFNDKPEYKKTDSFKKHDKPYGYDSFRPARSRNDSADLFWNDDDK